MADKWHQGRICCALRVKRVEVQVQLLSSISAPYHTNSPLLSLMILCLWVECVLGETLVA